MKSIDEINKNKEERKKERKWQAKVLNDRPSIV